MAEVASKEINEIEYIKAPLGKRFLAYFIDIGIIALFTFILFTLENVISNNMTWKKSLQNDLVVLRKESGLYINDVVLNEYIDTDAFNDDVGRRDFIDQQVNDFYEKPQYFTSTEPYQKYNERKLAATTDGIHLFKIVNEKVVYEESVNPRYIVNFYKSELTNTTLAYLYQYEPYSHANSLLFIGSVVMFVLALVIMFSVIYLVLPLTCFKRGRQSLGMKIMNISLINVRALNIKSGIFVGRFFFNLIVFIFLNFVSFLIPTFVSITMMFISKRSSSLTNYVFNDYVVLTKDDKIYMNEMEYMEKNFMLENTSIENKDLIIRH